MVSEQTSIAIARSSLDLGVTATKITFAVVVVTVTPKANSVVLEGRIFRPKAVIKTYRIIGTSDATTATTRKQASCCVP